MGGALQRPEGSYKAVILGETGSRKTSFLNLIGNLKAIVNLGKSRELTLEQVQHLHHEAHTDDINTPRHRSQTKRAHAHNIFGLGVDLTIIDTPGFGDTEGFEADRQNVESIKEVIASQHSIHCIVLVINGTVERVSPQLRYVLANVCAIVPKAILQQVVVVFTHVPDREDDLCFIPSSLTEFFGSEVPKSRQVCIQNPYARIARLVQNGGENPAKKLRTIKADCLEVAAELEMMFQEISSFHAVESTLFTEVYDCKERLEKKAQMLNHRLDNLHAERKRAEQCLELLNDPQRSKQIVSTLGSPMVVKKLECESTEGRHHMVCALCKSNCHVDCKIERAIDKVMIFKECKCFQTRALKLLHIETEEHRSSLLEHLVEESIQLVDPETSVPLSDFETNVCCFRNVCINGVTVRGEPDAKWVTARHITCASSFGGRTLEDLRTRTLPFTLKMLDYSNQELAADALCDVCNHPLKHHSHQTYLYKEVSTDEFYVDDAARERLLGCSSEEEKLKVALDAVKQKVNATEEAEDGLHEDLMQNLRDFKKLAGSRSYLSFLQEQETYVALLRANATEEGKEKLVKSLEEQLELIGSMWDACRRSQESAYRKASGQFPERQPLEWSVN